MRTIEVSDAAFNRIISKRIRKGESLSTIILREINAPEKKCSVKEELDDISENGTYYTASELDEMLAKAGAKINIG